MRTDGRRKQRADAQRRRAPVEVRAPTEQVDPPDGLLERAQTEQGELPARLLGDHQQVGLDHLRRPRELRAQLGPLRRDSDGTRVEMARAHEQAAFGEQERGAERDLVRAEQRGDDDVAAGLDPAVDAHAHAAAQRIRDERVLRLDETELPRRPRVLDRRQRTRAGAAVCAGDVDHVGERLRDAGGDESDARLRDELHGDVGARIDLAQVEDQLREILDRVDVVVRRRRDQRDAGPRVPKPGDLLGHLVARKLAALARL